MERDRLAWPILLLLLTVLIPSVGVVWMMREAVRNEQAATNQRLLEAYRLQLEQAANTLKDRWRTQQANLSDLVADDRPVVPFAKIITNDAVDSVVLCDQWGEVVYPNRERVVENTDSPNDPQWKAASRLEFVEGQYLEAAAAYDEVIENYDLPTDTIAAVLAKARCLDKAGDRQAAISVLQRVSRYWIEGARAESQKCAAYLRLLELSKKGSPRWKSASKQLELCLLDFEKYPMLSYQRNFLINEFQRLTGESGRFPTHDAESLAIKYVGQLDDGKVKLPGGIRLTKIPGVWQDYEEDSKLTSLYRTETLRKNLLSLCEEVPLSEGMAFSVTTPGETSGNLMDVSLGSEIGEWQLGLKAVDGNPFTESSKQQNAVYVWIAALTVAATCALAWFLMTALRQRMKLAQLKNDLVATVSHELKTPLSSIRLLVDTLLQNDGKPASEVDPNQTKEYLQLISAENARLSRLIDNFLTFSRMERGQQQFDFADVQLKNLVHQAASIFRDHCPDATEFLTVQVKDSAMVSCGNDSIVTSIVNLLENAWKYSDGEKQVVLKADVFDEEVAISVVDNGIGLSSREIERIFDRFYQVDQRVARAREGCGLGLSIVRSIVEAHGGTVSAKSEPDVGSTFTIRLPRVK